MIHNPILRGFHPDPSILRVGEDYFLATSTFEWFPGIRIHQSRDLKHWQLIGHALTRPSQLNLKNTKPSDGVWAPCLTFCERDQLYYLCYTFVNSLTSGMFDIDNYLVTAKSINGPWSDPVYLNSSGFDPSLYHGEDGRKWVVQLVWDFREGYEHPGFIALHEYSPGEKRLIGERRDIYHSKELGCVEGPHIYRRDGCYYLMTAEGGTGYGHSVNISRSRSISGPYEPYPGNPIITSTAQHYNGIHHLDYRKPFLFNPESKLQKSGHGSLVETQTGELYVAHLCSRPLLPQLRSTLGRETALQKVRWTEDGWLSLDGGGRLAQEQLPEPNLPTVEHTVEPTKDHFDNEKLGIEWMSLRVPVDESWASLSSRPGYLSLRGRESLSSLNAVSIVAKRVTSFDYLAETCIEFDPENFQQMAGLVCFYDDATYFYLRIYWSDSLHSRCIGIMSSDRNVRSEYLDSRVPIDGKSRVYLRAVVHSHDLQFFYSLDSQQWAAIGPVLDASKLSDEYCVNGGMTGSVVGITAQDFEQKSRWAHFDYFEYSFKQVSFPPLANYSAD